MDLILDVNTQIYPMQLGTYYLYRQENNFCLKIKNIIVLTVRNLSNLFYLLLTKILLYDLIFIYIIIESHHFYYLNRGF